LGLKFCQKNIVTFGELFLKSSDTIRPESTFLGNVLVMKYVHGPGCGNWKTTGNCPAACSALNNGLV